MTIHHDKLAYGKLASMREDMSDDKLLKMLKELNADETDGEQPPEETKEEKKNTEPSSPAQET